jgi:hypothetical protein
MDLVARLFSLRRRRHRPPPSRNSSGSSFEYGQPVNRLSGDFDPYQYGASDHPNLAHIRSAGIPIRSITPRSLPLLGTSCSSIALASNVSSEHPIDHVPRRDPNAILTLPSVKVHRRMLLQRTEFPRGDPPQSPRRQSQAEFSSGPAHGGRARAFHRVESVYSDSSNELHSNSPRLDTLRQDPSVLSLVSVMDSHGFIPSDVFTNSPATPCPAPSRHGRRPRPFSKSTPDLSMSTPSRVHASKRKHSNFR